MGGSYSSKKKEIPPQIVVVDDNMQLKTDEIRIVSNSNKENGTKIRNSVETGIFAYIYMIHIRIFI
jgi:hypothetical protein